MPAAFEQPPATADPREPALAGPRAIYRPYGINPLERGAGNQPPAEAGRRSGYVPSTLGWLAQLLHLGRQVLQQSVQALVADGAAEGTAIVVHQAHALHGDIVDLPLAIVVPQSIGDGDGLVAREDLRGHGGLGLAFHAGILDLHHFV